MYQNNPNQYRGQPTSKALSHGPVRDRSCSDIFCLFVFSVFWIGALMIAIFAFKNGNPNAFFTPYDQFGKPCGLNEQQKYPYLYFIKDGNTFKANNTVCLESCPTETTKTLSCSPDYSAAGKSCENIPVYQTSAFFKRFCLPTASSSMESLTKSHALDFGSFFEALDDLEDTWWMGLVVAGIALVIGFIYLYLMKLAAGLLVWTLILLFVLGTAAIGVFCLLQPEKAIPQAVGAMDQASMKEVGAVFIALSFILLLVVCCFRNRISLSIAVIKAASDFIQEESSVLTLTPFFFVKGLVFYLSWFAIAIHIIGTNNIHANKYHYPIAEIDWSDKSAGMLLYYVFAFIWNHEFDLALFQFIVSTTVCIWYFRKHGESTKGILTGIQRAIIHLGSLAFGSLLIAIFTFLRMIVNFLKNRRDSITNPNLEASLAISCCDCFLNCLESFLRFVNRHAYVQIAMTGNGYCKAAEDSFFLMMRNSARFGIVHGVGGLVMFFGHLFVTFSATVVGYLIITNNPYFQNELYSPVFPVIYFFVASLIVSHVILGVYGIAADSIIHCFSMDEEMNNGTAVNAPDTLKGFLADNLPPRLLDHPDN